MSNNLLKRIIGIIIGQLTNVFKLLSYRRIPGEFKISIIHPIFEKGPNDKSESYQVSHDSYYIFENCMSY